MLKRWNRGFELTRTLLRAAGLPQLAELGIVVRVLGPV